jgi:argininosuccinate lyase
VHTGYATATEIADALLPKAEVPFRIGHHFAGKLMNEEFRKMISAETMVFRRKGLEGGKNKKCNTKKY